MPPLAKPYSFWAEMFLWLLALLLMSYGIWMLDAHAQTKVEFRILSPGIEGKINKTYERAQCYALKDYLELAQFDSELFSCRRDTKTYLDLQGALEAQINAKDEVIRTLEADKKILADRSLRMETNWKTCEKSLVEASSLPIMPYVIATAGIVLGLGLAGSVYYLDHR